jgi:hypothetical protein
MRIDRRHVAAISIAVLLCSCGSAIEAARLRASREYDCPVSKVKARWIGSGLGNTLVIKVNACGTTATYACVELDETA